MLLLSCLLSFLSLATAILAQTCSILPPPPTGVADKRLKKYQVSHLLGFTLDRCVLECILVRLCASFNYRENLGICELSNVTAGEVVDPDMEHYATGFVYHDISNWSWGVAGSCSTRPCAENQRCLQTQPYTCTDVDCGNPPNEFIDMPPFMMHVTGSAASTRLGSVAEYSCGNHLAVVDVHWSKTVPFLNRKTKICNSDFTWTNNKLRCYLTGLKNCVDVKACNPSYPDGHYWIYQQGRYTKKVKVYCHDMATSPKTYITLHSVDNVAFDAGNVLLNFPTTTTFTKIRIDSHFRVHRSDFTFATGAGLPYGEAASCNGDVNNKVYGYFRINTVGTGVTIEETDVFDGQTFTNTWAAAATGGSELVNLTYAGGEVSGLCWGQCGTCAPTTTYLRLSVNRDEQVDGSDTVHPTCV